MILAPAEAVFGCELVMHSLCLICLGFFTFFLPPPSPSPWFHSSCGTSFLQPACVALAGRVIWNHMVRSCSFYISALYCSSADAVDVGKSCMTCSSAPVVMKGGEPIFQSLLWHESWAPPLFILICILLNWCLLFLWECGTSSMQSYLPKCILFTLFSGGAVITAGKQVRATRGCSESCPPVTVQGMHRSALLSSSDEQWQACKLIVWITGTARAAVTRFAGQIC